MSDDAPGERLAKRVAALRACSRAEAERLIAAGAVRVDGAVVCLPQARVRPDQRVDCEAQRAAVDDTPRTLLWHKPAGLDLPPDAGLSSAALGQWLRAAGAAELADALPGGGPRWTVVAPLAPMQSGLLVIGQHPGVLRHLRERAADLEHEWLVDVADTGLDPATRQAWQRGLGDPLQHSGRPLMPAKVSWQSDTRLRLAIKGCLPGQLDFLLARASIPAVAVRRQRLGRVALGGLAPGQGRELLPTERF